MAHLSGNFTMSTNPLTNSVFDRDALTRRSQHPVRKVSL